MTDEEAIRRLVAAYGERLDAGDLDGVAAMFAGATWRSGSRTLRGPDEVRDVYDDVILYDGRPRTRHVMSDVVVAVEGDGATSTCTFTVFQELPDFPLQAVLVGRYLDSFARTPSGWELRDREIHVDLVGDLSRHMRRR
ncbi:MAG: nuclear transport factor 2 family protein [Acidimicrobiia bacterium]